MQSPAESSHLSENLAKADRLFRAAIAGYCSLAATNRADAGRLDELAMPLLPLVGEETLRFASATLSACTIAPPALMRRLSDMPVAISAPLLVGSPALADIDLIGIIGRNGLEHARAVAQRRGLNPNIASLIRALGLSGALPDESAPGPAAEVEPAAVTPPANASTPLAPRDDEPTETDTRQAVNRLLAAAGRAQAFIDRRADNGSPEAALQPAPHAAEDVARDKLRAMMRPSGRPVQEPEQVDGWAETRATYPRLVATGLTGRAALFQTALADGLDLDFATAASILDATSDARLATCLKAMGLDTSEAFFVAALACPPRYSTTAAIRDFVTRYRHADVAAARDDVEAWRGRAADAAPAAANSQEATADIQRLLRAS